VGFSWKGRLRVGVGLQYRYQDKTWAAWPSGPEPSPLQQLLSTLPPNPPEGIALTASHSFSLYLTSIVCVVSCVCVLCVLCVRCQQPAGMVMAAIGALERQPLEKLLSFAGFEP
jgi:hypothetical protein